MLAVGDSTRLEIIFSTKTYKSKVSKSPRITTNEGQSDKRVTITASIVPRPDSTYPLILQPYKLDLSQFSDKVIDQIDFTITNVTDKPLDVSMVYFPTDYCDVTLPKTIAPGEAAPGHLTLKKSAYDKSFEKSFTIEVNDQNKSRFTIPIKRKIRTTSLPGTTKTSPSGK